MKNYAHCAKIENNIVLAVIACTDVDWCITNIGGNWLPVYDDNYWGVGWTWDGERFLPPEIEEVEDEIN